MNLCETFWVILSREVHMKAALLISQTRQMCCEVFSLLPPQASYPLPLLVESSSVEGHVCLFLSNWPEKLVSKYTTVLFVSSFVLKIAL